MLAQILMTRDQQGRITKVTDPAGKSIVYVYDGNGDLASMTDRVGATTQYRYDRDESGVAGSLGRPHFLTDIIDARGITVAHASFGTDPESPDFGRMTGLVDASGNAAPFGFNLDLGGGLVSQSVTDALGNPTELVVDSRGNVVRKIQRLSSPTELSNPALVKYIVTVTLYEDGANPDRETAVSQPFMVVGNSNALRYSGVPDDVVWTSRAGYDAAGNQTSSTDALGNVTYSTFDAYGNVLTTTDPLGNTTTNTYDPRTGNLLSSSDGHGNVTRYRYANDGSGRFDHTEDPLGNPSGTMSYDDHGRVASSTDAFGVTHAYGYDAPGGGNQTSDTFTWVDPSDPAHTATLTTTTQYDPASRVTRSTDARGNSTAQTYDASGRVVTTTDSLGLVTQNTYNARGLLVQTRRESRTAGGSVAWLIARTIYDANGRAVLATDPNLEGTEDPILASVTAYDPLGRTKELHRVSGVVVTLTGSGDIKESAVDPAHEGTLIPLSSSGSITYDAAGRVVESTDAFGTVSQTVYDAVGQVIESRRQSRDENDDLVWVVSNTVYDRFGRAYLSTQPHVEGSSDPVLGSRTLYDSQGRAYSTQTLQGVVVDLEGSVETGDLHSVLATPGTVLATTTTVFDDTPGRQGRVLRSIDARGGVTDYEYDSLGRQSAVIMPATPDPDLTLSGGGGGHPLVRRRIETVYEGFDGQASATIDNLKQFATPSQAPTGSVNGVDRSHARTTTQTYDAFGQLIRTMLPDGATTSSVYDSMGRQTAAIDPLGRVTTYEYDSQARLSAVELPAVQDPRHLGDPTRLLRPRWEYTYDAKGNQVSILANLGRDEATGDVVDLGDALMGASELTTFKFDGQGRQTGRILPLGQPSEGEEQRYDDAGRLSLSIDFKGQVTHYVYDDRQGSNGRLAAKEFFVDEDAYDDGEGEPAESVDYTYDALGRTVEVTQHLASGDRTVANTYDAWGHLIRTASPEGAVNYAFDPGTGDHTRTWTGDYAGTSPATDTRYAYDVLGRLSTVTAYKVLGATPEGGPQTTTYFYSLDGSLDHVALPAGVVTEYTYDTSGGGGRGEILELSHTDANGVLLSDYRYTYNPDGSRASAVETTLQGDGGYSVTTIGWLYDGDNRLIQEYATSNVTGTGQNYTTTYSLDLVGNHIAKATDEGNNGPSAGDSTTTYEYNANDQLTQDTTTVLAAEGNDDTITVTTYTWDANGSQTAASHAITAGAGVGTTTTDTFTYDLRNKMVQAVVNGVTSGYVYDDVQNRVKQTTGSAVTLFLTDVQNPTGYAQPIEQRTGTTSSLPTAATAPTISYVIGMRVMAQAVVGQPVTLLLTDAHGSTRLTVSLTFDSGTSHLVAALAARLNYDAFGGARSYNASSPPTLFLFGGDAVFDPAAGIFFHGNGIRQRSDARFMQTDAYSGVIADPLSLNKLLYANSNSIQFVDASGYMSFPEIMKVSFISGMTMSLVHFSTSKQKSAARSAVIGAEAGGLTAYLLMPGRSPQDKGKVLLAAAFGGMVKVCAERYKDWILAQSATPMPPWSWAHMNLFVDGFVDSGFWAAVGSFFKAEDPALAVAVSSATAAVTASITNILSLWEQGRLATRDVALHTFVAVIDALLVGSATYVLWKIGATPGVWTNAGYYAVISAFSWDFPVGLRPTNVEGQRGR
ncbi:MAG: hypothetical protein NTW19_01205 [Planctomycetota bacterium]|nr:hypothetical protein [Planctomycetota bacterium]